MPYKVNPRIKNQTEPRPGTHKAEGGGQLFTASDKDILRRFLLIGTAEDSYYTSAEVATEKAVELVKSFAVSQPKILVDEICNTWNDGHGRVMSHKQSAGFVAIAAVMSFSDVMWRQLITARISWLVPTLTGLYEVIEYMKQFGRGWGKTAKRLVAEWFNRNDIPYQMAKYQSRNGWGHADLIKLAHLNPTKYPCGALFDWSIKRTPVGLDYPYQYGMALVNKADNAEGVIEIIRGFGLTREMIPSKWHNDPTVMNELLTNMPFTALIRNLGNYAAAGLHDFGTDSLEKTVKKLKKGDKNVHPMAIWMAIQMYSQGHGDKSSKTWRPNSHVVNALTEAYEKSFANAKPWFGKTLVAVDCSGSMHGKSLQMASAIAWMIGRINGLNSKIIAAAEQVYSSSNDFDGCAGPLELEQKIRRETNGGSTNLSAILQWANAQKVRFSRIIILSDCQANTGQAFDMALDEYRKKGDVNIFAAQMVFNDVSLFNNNQKNVFNICGVDANLFDVIENAY